MTPTERIRAFLDANKGRDLVLYVNTVGSLPDGQVDECRSFGLKVIEHPMVRHGEAYIMPEFDPADHPIPSAGLVKITGAMS